MIILITFYLILLVLAIILTGTAVSLVIDTKALCLDIHYHLVYLYVDDILMLLLSAITFITLLTLIIVLLINKGEYINGLPRKTRH